MATDDELVELTCLGEVEAFAELVRRHERMVYGMVYGMVGEADARDVAQEIFLEAFKSLKRFRREASFKTWLARIVIHRTASFHRQRSVRLTLPLEATRGEGESEWLDIPDGTQNPEVKLSQSEQDEMIKEAMERLPVEYRQTLALRLTQGMSYEDISSVLSCSIGTVKSRLHNGRILLIRFLRERGL